MKKNYQNYDRFLSVMTDGMLYVNPAVSFHVACLLLGAEEKELDTLLLEETGFSGDELIGRYRQSYQKFLQENFGIQL